MDNDTHVLLFDMEMFKPRNIEGALSLPSVTANHNLRVLEFLMQAQQHFKLVFLYHGGQNTIGKQLMSLHMPEDVCYSMQGLEYAPQSWDYSPYHDCPILTDNISFAQNTSDQLGLHPIPTEFLNHKNGYGSWYDSYRREAGALLSLDEQRKLAEALLDDPQISKLVQICPHPFTIGYAGANENGDLILQQTTMKEMVHLYIEVMANGDYNGIDNERAQKLFRTRALMRLAFKDAMDQKATPTIPNGQHDGVTEIISKQPRNAINPAIRVMHQAMRGKLQSSPS